MKYIILAVIILMSLGCENKESVKSADSISNTASLQPSVTDKSQQPPAPPSLK